MIDDLRFVGIVFHSCCTCNSLNMHFTSEAEKYATDGVTKTADVSDPALVEAYRLLAHPYYLGRLLSKAHASLCGIPLSEVASLVPVFIDDVGECGECAAVDYR